MLARYEYTVVKMFGELRKNADQDWTSRINEFAAEGWRVVAVSDLMVFLERPVND